MPPFSTVQTSAFDSESVCVQKIQFSSQKISLTNVVDDERDEAVVDEDARAVFADFGYIFIVDVYFLVASALLETRIDAEAQRFAFAKLDFSRAALKSSICRRVARKRATATQTYTCKKAGSNLRPFCVERNRNDTRLVEASRRFAHIFYRLGVISAKIILNRLKTIRYCKRVHKHLVLNRSFFTIATTVLRAIKLHLHSCCTLNQIMAKYGAALAVVKEVCD